MKKLKMAVLGVGPRGEGAMNTYAMHPQVEMVSVCDRAEGLAEQVAERFRKAKGAEVKAFTSYEELMNGPAFDALFIASDPDVQVDYAVDAMNRGIHVMTEVPAAYTIDQCRRLVDTVRKTGVKYQLAEQTRYSDYIKKWRGMNERGEFGKIIYAEGHYLHYEPKWDYFTDNKTEKRVDSAPDPSMYLDPYLRASWRQRTFRNPILYLPHTLSPLLSVTGGRITKVACFGTRPLGYTAEGMNVRDLQHAIMYNSDDVIFSVRAGFTSPHGGNNIVGAHWHFVKGTKAAVELPRGTLDESKKWTADGGWTNESYTVLSDDADEYAKKSAHGGMDWYPMPAFVDAILNDTAPPMDVYKAVETAAPAILAAESCEKGGVMLEVPDFRAK